MSQLLIKNAEIVTVNKENDIIHGDVLIEDDRIIQIDTGISEHGVDKVVDARHKTVIPGFIQTHIHLCQTIFRGRVMILS